MADETKPKPWWKRIPTWLGLLLFVLAILLGGALGLLGEWLTAPRVR